MIEEWMPGVVEKPPQPPIDIAGLPFDIGDYSEWSIQWYEFAYPEDGRRNDQ